MVQVSEPVENLGKMLYFMTWSYPQIMGYYIA